MPYPTEEKLSNRAVVDDENAVKGYNDDFVDNKNDDDEDDLDDEEEDEDDSELCSPLPADDDEELDEQQRVRGAVALLGPREVQGAVPQLGAEQH